ncbi:MAG: fasciclin domain-containing protein [Bacteroidaceae bacterium]|nr:fasciclin domain-containing protein [Bacteroidaceae bacterium]
MKKTLKYMVGVLLASFAMGSCVDNDDVVVNYYASTKVTAAGFLEENPERFSQFINILQRTPYFALLSTYGNFTLFAPTNEAIDKYVNEMGLPGIEALTDENCDTLARTHIIRKGAYFTVDVVEGAMPEMTMEDSYIVLSSDSDVYNNNELIYYINKNARMIEYDDSVTNGVVHTVNSVITRTSDFLPDRIAADTTLTLFTQAMELTNMDDSLRYYLDLTYSCGEDSVFDGYPKKCKAEGASPCFWPEKRYFKYTAFVEPDAVFEKEGIKTIDDLIDFAKTVYDQTYPEDAGLYDDDFTHRKNPLNRFVSYHFLPMVLQYNNILGPTQILEKCWLTNVTDPEEFFETLCPNTLMRVAQPANVGLFINRKGFQKRIDDDCRGVRVLSPSESGSIDQNALNGVYHYLDDILVYDTKVRDVVLNCRIRKDATTLSPDFVNSGGRGRLEANELKGMKKGYIAGWTISDDTFVGVHSDQYWWQHYYSNGVTISGIFDVSFDLPPVPSGTYELRFGYTANVERGVVQVYLNNEPCGIPVDLRVMGGDPRIGWIADTEDEDENIANDKAMHNRGYMKGIDSYAQNGENIFRANTNNLRRVLFTKYLDANEKYTLRLRQVLDDPECYLSFDFIELCPKSVYASPEGEDTH